MLSTAMSVICHCKPIYLTPTLQFQQVFYSIIHFMIWQCVLTFDLSDCLKVKLQAMILHVSLMILSPTLCGWLMMVLLSLEALPLSSLKKKATHNLSMSGSDGSNSFMFAFLVSKGHACHASMWRADDGKSCPDQSPFFVVMLIVVVKSFASENCAQNGRNRQIT